MNRGKLKPVNRKRLATLREVQFGISSGYHAWVMEQPCAACGSFNPNGRTEPAHVGQTRGAGARADKVLSLCRQCHQMEHDHKAEFTVAFYLRHGVLPVEMAAYRYYEFHKEAN